MVQILLNLRNYGPKILQNLRIAGTNFSGNMAGLHQMIGQGTPLHRERSPKLGLRLENILRIYCRVLVIL